MLIGNYGNKLDTNTPAQSSTTPPTNPVFDGTKYYFLPWMDQPQICVVDSRWEDCTYRIESANIILFTADHLVREEESRCWQLACIPLTITFEYKFEQNNVSTLL